MSDRKKPRSLSEIVNDVLRAVRDYYDSEYVYYIEKEYGDIETNRGRLQCEFAAG